VRLYVRGLLQRTLHSGPEQARAVFPGHPASAPSLVPTYFTAKLGGVATSAYHFPHYEYVLRTNEVWTYVVYGAIELVAVLIIPYFVRSRTRDFRHLGSKQP
jgi:hypothetical protein